MGPSPGVLAPGDTFLIKNLTGGKATVDFGRTPIVVQGPNPFTKTTTARVAAHAAAGYYEYEITVVRKGKRRKRRVKGGSQPGVIIDG